MNGENTESPYKTASDSSGTDKEEEEQHNKTNQKELPSQENKNGRGKKRGRRTNYSPEVITPKRPSQARNKHWKKVLNISDSNVEDIIGVTPTRESKEEKNTEEMEDLKKVINDLRKDWKVTESKREEESKGWNILLKDINGKLDKKFEELETRMSKLNEDIKGMREDFKTDLKKLEEKMRKEVKDRIEGEKLSRRD